MEVYHKHQPPTESDWDGLHLGDLVVLICPLYGDPSKYGAAVYEGKLISLTPDEVKLESHTVKRGSIRYILT